MEIEILTYFENIWKDFAKFLPKLIIAFFIILFFLFIASKTARLVRKRLQLRTSDDLLAEFIGKITKLFLFIFGFIIVMEVLGFASLAGGLITGAGVSAVILGFAFKNIGENFLSGLLLAFNRPFKVGDVIHTEGYTGTITSMNFRTTNIKTMDGQYVFIPNSMIINNPLSNYTFESKRRFDFTIQFDYTNDIDKAKIVIYNSLQKINEVITDPKPLVIVDQLTTSTSVKIYYWLDTHVVERNLMEIKSEVIEVSRKDLNDAGIFITDVTQIKIMNENIPFEINSKLN